MSNQPLVSVILPVFNGEKTLKDTIQSILRQSYTRFEIIIGIDGSKDKSIDIAKSFNDPRIKIIEHQNNLGLARNLNVLIKNANPSTDYFAMAEQDDVYVPKRFQWQVEFMEANTNIGLVSGIAEFVSEKNNVLFPGQLVYGGQFPLGIELFKFLYVNQLKVVNTCMLWRKTIHDVNNLAFKDTYGNFNVDWNFILRFSLIANIHGLNKVLVYMKRHKSHVSVTSDKSGQHNASRQLLFDIKEEFPQIINRRLFNEALKNHRKIELGHRSKLGIVFYGNYFPSFGIP